MAFRATKHGYVLLSDRAAFSKQGFASPIRLAVCVQELTHEHVSFAEEDT